MRFRTEIEPRPNRNWLNPETPVTLLGSCFADNIGTLLLRDGFDAVHNPMGPLYNPLSVAKCISDAIEYRRYTPDDFIKGPRGYHCLDYASRYSGDDPALLADTLNRNLETLGQRITQKKAQVLTVTFGTAHAYYLDGTTLVGNCHKFPTDRFVRKRLTEDEIVGTWHRLLSRLPEEMNIVLTVSPVRHLADGLHGNRLSKALLLLATESICEKQKTDYFPAYEILEDDLRDYRFYNSDLKHPSDFAAEYIYEYFMRTYMTPAAQSSAVAGRQRSLSAAHRPILPD